MSRIVYSILQYRHSLLRDETYNIGIVFYFPDADDKILFYSTPQITVLKTIYPDMDYQMLTTYITFIDTSVRRGKIIHYPGMSVDMELKMFLRQSVLLEDSTVLRFANPVVVSNLDSVDSENVLKNFIKILLSFQNSDKYNPLRNWLMQ